MSLTSPRWCVCVPRVYVCLCVCVAGAVGPSPMDEEVFNTADEQCTPQIGRTPLKFRPPEQRAPSLAPQGSSVSRPDYDDFLRRCAVVLYQACTIHVRHAPCLSSTASGLILVVQVPLQCQRCNDAANGCQVGAREFWWAAHQHRRRGRRHRNLGGASWWHVWWVVAEREHIIA